MLIDWAELSKLRLSLSNCVHAVACCCSITEHTVDSPLRAGCLSLMLLLLLLPQLIPVGRPRYSCQLSSHKQLWVLLLLLPDIMPLLIMNVG